MARSITIDLPPAEQLLASAIQYLIDGDEKEPALTLMSCEADYGNGNFDGETTNYDLHLLGPRSVYEAFHRQEEMIDETNWVYQGYPSEMP